MSFILQGKEQNKSYVTGKIEKSYSPLLASSIGYRVVESLLKCSTVLVHQDSSFSLHLPGTPFTNLQVQHMFVEFN